MISILIPYIRPEGAALAEKAARKNAGTEDIEVLTEYDKDRIGCPKTLKNLVERAKGEYLCFIGDDSIPAPDFLKIAMEEMREFPDGIGLIGFGDNSGRPFADHVANHFVMHRALLDDLNGEIFHTGYRHCFCDNELQERLTGRYKISKRAIVLHDHPEITGKEQDEDYKWVYSSEIFEHDRKLFEQRKENGWKTKNY